MVTAKAVPEKANADNDKIEKMTPRTTRMDALLKIDMLFSSRRWCKGPETSRTPDIYGSMKPYIADTAPCDKGAFGFEFRTTRNSLEYKRMYGNRVALDTIKRGAWLHPV